MGEEIYGTDYNTLGTVTASGDISTVDGYENVKQAIRNRLLTREGMYPSIDDEYGCLCFELLGEDLNKTTIATITTVVRNSLLQDPHVAEINEITPFLGVDRRVKLKLDLTLVDDYELNMLVILDDEEESLSG